MEKWISGVKPGDEQQVQMQPSYSFFVRQLGTYCGLVVNVMAVDTIMRTKQGNL